MYCAYASLALKENEFIILFFVDYLKKCYKQYYNDIEEFDECVLTDHGCEHDCTNTLGGYECSCKVGYELHSDGKHCEGKIQ